MRDPFLPPERVSRAASGLAVVPRPRAGWPALVVVGTGTMAVNHMTIEARGWIEAADVVHCCEVDPVVERWIRTLNDRVASPDAFVEETLAHVRAGRFVAAVHDAYSTASGRACREAIGRARDEGFDAIATASISPAESLFADLLLDPWQGGVQLYDCAEFVRGRRRPDTSVGLVLRSIDRAQPLSAATSGGEGRCDPSIVAALSPFYDLQHVVVIHLGAPYVVCRPVLERYRLDQLTDAPVAVGSTLYVPPRS